MKPLPLILAFLPLIAFSLLARLLPSGSIGVAALVAFVIAAAIVCTARPLWPPKIVNACSVVLFGVLTVLGFALGKNDDSWLATWGGAGVGLVMGLTVLLLVPIMPFTEQFARDSTPREYWNSPTFKQINKVLSIAWGLAIVALGISRVVAAIVARNSDNHRATDIILGTVVPVGIIMAMLKFTRSYADRASHKQG
jgi:hypothetical protein